MSAQILCASRPKCSAVLEHLHLIEKSPPICSMLDKLFTYLATTPTRAPAIKTMLQQHCSGAKSDTISGLLSSLLATCTPACMHLEEIYRIQMVGEICIALFSQPPLNLETLKELQKHYLNFAKSESTHTVWKLLKLACALHSLRHNLLTPLGETTPELLEKLNMLALPLESSLQEAYKLLHGKTKNQYLASPIVISKTAQILCTQSRCPFVLQHLHHIEKEGFAGTPQQDKRATSEELHKYLEPATHLPPTINPSPSSLPEITTSFLLKCFQAIIDNPTQLRSVVANIFHIHHPHITEEIPISSMIFSVKESLPINSKVNNRRKVLMTQALGELSVFLLEEPPLDIALFKEVKSEFRTQDQIGIETQNQTILRLQMRLAYALQTLKNSLSISLQTVRQLTSHLNIHQSKLDTALTKAHDLLTQQKKHPHLPYIERNIATDLCTTSPITMRFILDCITRLESNEDLAEENNSELSSDEMDFTRPDGLYEKKARPSQRRRPCPNLSGSYLYEQLQTILHDPTQTLRVLENICHTLDITPPNNNSCASLYKAICQCLSLHSTCCARSSGILSIGALCAFILSDPSFDFCLFKEVETQYPNHFLIPKQKTLSALNNSRIHIKITYTLQNLRSNLIPPSHTLGDLLRLLDIHTSNAETALQQALHLQEHKNLKAPLKISPAVQLLCKPKVTCQTTLKVLEKVEKKSSTNKKPKRYKALLNGGYLQ